MFIYIGGVPGVGKTTILTNMERLAADRGLKLERVVGTKILCELTGAKTVEELRVLPEEIRAKHRQRLNEILYERDREDFDTVRIADGHFCYFDTAGEKYGIRQIYPWDRKQTYAMGVITAQTSTILERRLADREARTDRQLSPGFIEMEQFLELGIAFYQANELSIPINIFRNEKGTSIDKISGEILGYVNDVISNRSKSIGNYRS